VNPGRRFRYVSRNCVRRFRGNGPHTGYGHPGKVAVAASVPQAKTPAPQFL
jgi:hypothetical protein